MRQTWRNSQILVRAQNLTTSTMHRRGSISVGIAATKCANRFR
jgi:hypothetical protein